MIYDTQFLNEAALFEVDRHIIYVYREKSGALKSKVRKRIFDMADQSGYIRSGADEGQLCNTILKNSLFGMVRPLLIICHISERRVRKTVIEDLEDSLRLIAERDLEKQFFLMVPNKIVARIDPQVWERAIGKVTHIEEPVVTRENIREVLEGLLGLSDLGNFGELGRTRSFKSHFKRFISEEEERTLLETLMALDLFVLTSIESASPSGASRSAAVRRQFLRRRLRGFLDIRDEESLRGLLLDVDDLCYLRMEDAADVLVKLYQRTAFIIAGKDNRYKRVGRRDSIIWEYVVWGMLLLSAHLVEDGFLAAFEKLCRDFMDVENHEGWLCETDRWQRIASELVRAKEFENEKRRMERLEEREEAEETQDMESDCESAGEMRTEGSEPKRVSEARLDLVNILEKRLEPARSSLKLDWLWLSFQNREDTEEARPA